MKSHSWFVVRGSWSAAALVVFLMATAAPAQEKAVRPADSHDVLFLGEARPVHVRLHVLVDGRPLREAGDAYFKHLFGYLDVNGDGALSKDEAARAPAMSELTGGTFGLAGGFGRRPGGGKGKSGPSQEALDADSDGKVTQAELAAYYRKNGYVPFQLQTDGGQGNAMGMMAAMYGGRGAEPTVSSVSNAAFALLDANKDGKLSREELAAAPEALFKMDEDDDEIVTAREVAPVTNAGGGFGALAMMARGGSTPNPTAGNNTLVPVPPPGGDTANLVRRLRDRYEPTGGTEAERKHTRKDLGLDEAAFAALDADRDGLLNEKELTGFANRQPDLELVLRLGTRGAGEARVEVLNAGASAPVAGKARVHDGVVALDLGRTRLDLRGSAAGDRTDMFAGLVRGQIVGQFSGADKDRNGYLDAEEAKASRFFGGLYAFADRDGDGKLHEKEINDYLTSQADLQRRAKESCVTLVLEDHSRGLFDLLDVNRDGRLGPREARGAVKLLDRLGGGKGHLTKADLPRSYRLTLRRGTVGGGGQEEALAALYGGPEEAEEEAAGAGPAWFRKMDRSRDGDVSPREFLFSAEEFRRIDADGDGLISADEATRYDAQARKRK